MEFIYFKCNLFIILLKLLISDYQFFLPILLNLFIIWSIFFKNNLSFINKKNNWDKSISVKNIILKQNPIFLIKLSILLNILQYIYIYTYCGFNTTFWWSHFKLNNYLLYIYIIIILFNVLFLFISSKHIKLNNKYVIDYIFSILNITIIIPVIFITNTLFTFFFFIELVSCCIFYNFILSKFNFNSKANNSANFSIYSKNYINILFFQFWSSFFSSILLVFSIYSIYSLVGSTEWSVINFVIESNKQLNYLSNNILIIITSTILFVGFIIKLGIAPLQLYKVEVYKGLPFLSIFFYTTFYFLIFFLYFSLIFIYYLSSFIYIFWILLLFVIILGIIYIIALMFDINLFKSFLAYSTIINSISFLILTLSLIF
jgi:NADH:ubiquinone oxidoreductase subunit 2 (subunit N)